jgi:hypothetical protein
VSEHPLGGWRLVGELEPDFPFPVGPDTWVLTRRALITGDATVARVIRDQGNYDILDESGYEADDLCLAFLGELVRRHPHIAVAASLADGQLAAFDTGSEVSRAYIGKDDRRASKRCWTLAEPAAHYGQPVS